MFYCNDVFSFPRRYHNFSFLSPQVDFSASTSWYTRGTKEIRRYQIFCRVGTHVSTWVIRENQFFLPYWYHMHTWRYPAGGTSHQENWVGTHVLPRYSRGYQIVRSQHFVRRKSTLAATCFQARHLRYTCAYAATWAGSDAYDVNYLYV